MEAPGDELPYEPLIEAFLASGRTLLAPAFRYDVILVRPTRIEGDAVAVREAVHAGVPVVASDVVERHSGAATFATGDVAGLRCTLEHVLDGTGAAPPPAYR